MNTPYLSTDCKFVPRAPLGTLLETFCGACREVITGHPDEPKPVKCEGCRCDLHGDCAAVADELPYCAACYPAAIELQEAA